VAGEAGDCEGASLMFEELKSAEGSTILRWQCDEGCGSVAEFDGGDFMTCWYRLRAMRWQAMRIDSEGWHHICPKCRRTGQQILDARPK
jgi:hypothetical protein